MLRGEGDRLDVICADGGILRVLAAELDGRTLSPKSLEKAVGSRSLSLGN